MLKELKEDVDKVKKMMCEQNKNIDKEIENLNRNWKESLELKNSITEIKISLEGIIGRTEQAEERISELEHRIMQMIESEELKEQRLKKCDQKLRTHVIPSTGLTYRLWESPGGRKREKEAERIFEEIMAENFPNVMEDTNVNI